jgi:hypothetical protein
MQKTISNWRRRNSGRETVVLQDFRTRFPGFIAIVPRYVPPAVRANFAFGLATDKVQARHHKARLHLRTGVPTIRFGAKTAGQAL